MMGARWRHGKPSSCVILFPTKNNLAIHMTDVQRRKRWRAVEYRRNLDMLRLLGHDRELDPMAISASWFRISTI